MQQDENRISEVELEIDRSFANSKLPEIGYAQAVWTLLAFNEDAFLKALRDADHEHDMHIFADRNLNALRHPLRVCFERADRKNVPIQPVLIEHDYRLAWKWSEAAVQYDQFCTIFPLWHRHRIGLAIDGKRLVITDFDEPEHEYEAYNRLIRKESRPEPDPGSMPDEVKKHLAAAIRRGADWFYVKFSPKLVSALVSWLFPAFNVRYTLPKEWGFDGFTLRDYQNVYSTLQCMLFAWHHVRMELAASGMPGLGYRSSIWTVSKDELFGRLRRYTGVHSGALQTIIALLTFGSNGIREPDPATQPLVDLENGSYALSPFVWLNSARERNLCVLLNQIPSQRRVYSALTNAKEATTKGEIVASLSHLDLSFADGTVAGTDLDLAIIDHHSRACLCLELKWFIEPAEIRESEARTKDLATGGAQAKIVNKLFVAQDDRLIKDILHIDPDYSFLSAVGSQNWIGFADVQDQEISIIKVYHLVSRILETGSLMDALIWLRERKYLPREGEHYSIIPTEISYGGWTATWYGLKPH